MLDELAAAPEKRSRAMLVAGQRVVDKYVVVRELGHADLRDRLRGRA